MNLPRNFAQRVLPCGFGGTQNSGRGIANYESHPSHSRGRVKRQLDRNLCLIVQLHIGADPLLQLLRIALQFFILRVEKDSHHGDLRQARAVRLINPVQVLCPNQ